MKLKFFVQLVILFSPTLVGCGDQQGGSDNPPVIISPAPNPNDHSGVRFSPGPVDATPATEPSVNPSTDPATASASTSGAATAATATATNPDPASQAASTQPTASGSPAAPGRSTVPSSTASPATKEKTLGLLPPDAFATGAVTIKTEGSGKIDDGKLTCLGTTTDADGDVLSYSTSWESSSDGGKSFSPLSIPGSDLDTLTLDKFEKSFQEHPKLRCRRSATDKAGSGKSVEAVSQPLDVLNSKPTGKISNLSGSLGFDDTDLLASVTISVSQFFDLDMDRPSVSYDITPDPRFPGVPCPLIVTSFVPVSADGLTWKMSGSAVGIKYPPVGYACRIIFHASDGIDRADAGAITLGASYYFENITKYQ